MSGLMENVKLSVFFVMIVAFSPSKTHSVSGAGPTYAIVVHFRRDTVHVLYRNRYSRINITIINYFQ